MMEQSSPINKNPNYQDDEITLKELLLAIGNYVTEVWKNKFLIILISIPFIALMFYKAINTPPEYVAQLRFIVESESGGSGGMLGGLLGQFGIRRGTSGANPYQMVEVAKSPDVLKEVLFQRLASENNDFVANVIIRDYELDENWIKRYPEMKGFRFTHDSIAIFSPIENRAFRSVMGRVLGPKKKPKLALLSVGVNDETGIFTLSGKTESESVSVALVEQTYETIKYFYEEKTLENQRQTRDLLKSKVDSLQALINQKQVQLARFQDASRGVILEEKLVQRNILSRDISTMTLALGEATKSFEMADYAYRDRKPLFVAIDRPIPPISPEENSKLKALIIGILLGAFIGIGFVIGRKIIRDALAE
jgi:capsular polysaccharide biosynthesis protein